MAHVTDPMEKTPTKDPFEEAKLVLSRLSAAFTRRDDRRRYGVNAAWQVLNEMTNGDSMAHAIRRIVKDYSEDEKL